MKPWQETAQRYLISAILVFVVLAMYPLAADMSFDIKVLGYELGAFAALCIWLVTPRHMHDRNSRVTAMFLLLVAFVGLNFVAAIVSLNVGYSLGREFIKLLALFILFLAASDVFRSPGSVWNLATVICVAVSLASIYGFLQHFGLDPYPWEDTSGMLRSAPSTFGNPNFASHVLAPSIVLACGLATQKGRRWAVLFLPIFLGHFAITRTRGSLLGLVCAAMVVLIALLVSRKIKKTGSAIAVTLIVMLVLGIAGIATLASYARATTGQPYPFGEGESMRLRYHSFYGACQMIQESPWLGYGPGMYRVANPTYWTPFERARFSEQTRSNAHVHNEPLEFAVDAGLPAAIVYVSILILGIYYGLYLGLASKTPEQRRLGMTLAALFVVFLIDGMFGFNLHVPASTALFFVALGMSSGTWQDYWTSAERQPSFGRFALGWRIVAACCAVLIPFFGTRDYRAQIWHSRGVAMVKEEEYQVALECLQKAESLVSYDWNHPYKLGTTYRKMGRLEEAANSLKRTLHLNPNYVVAMFEISKVLFNQAISSQDERSQSTLDDVIAYAEQAAKLNPQFPDVHDDLGRAYLLQATWMKEANYEPQEDIISALRSAEHHLLKAIEYGSKQQNEVYRVIAAARLGRGDESGAKRALVKSLEQKPDDMDTWQFYLHASEESGRYDSILASLDRRIEYLERLSNSNPQEVGVLHLIRANVLFHGIDDSSGAEIAYVEALNTSPGLIDAWRSYYEFARDTRREGEFEKYLMRMAANEAHSKELPPPVPVVAQALGGDESELVGAVSSLMDALEKQRTVTPNGRDLAARFSWAADALAQKAQQETLSPADSGAIYLGLGLIFSSCQEFGTAVTMFDRAMPNVPEDQRLFCLMKKGEALINDGEFDAAVQVFEQAKESAPSDFNVRYTLARAFARNGQLAQARLEYRALLTTFRLDEETRDSILREIESISD